MKQTIVALWRGHRGLVLVGAAVFVVGIALGVTAGHLVGRRSAPAPVMLSADPPATETSQQTVVEDEPWMPPAPPPAPSESVASLPPPHPVPPAPSSGQAAWEKYALIAPPAAGRPMLAVIIDDMGLDKRRSDRILQLPGPLTISFMSYAEDLGRQTAEARARGHELMMHVPMEPLGEGIDPGPGALLETLPVEEIRKRLVEDLGRFTGYVGINNHMGSRFTAFAPGMQVVMEELHRRGLLFVDSLTTDRSVGLVQAQRAGVPNAGRNVFLDNDPSQVNAQLARLEELARKRGSAIAIGHPRDATIAALAAWLPTLSQKGLVLVPVTAVVRAHMSLAAAAATPASATH